MNAEELLDQLRRFDGTPRQFLINLLAAQCMLGRANNGAFVQVGQDDNIDVLALFPVPEDVKSAPEWLVKSTQYVREALFSDSIIIKPLEEPGQLYGQTPKYHLIAMPSSINELGRAIAVFLIRNEQSANLQASAQQLQLSFGMLQYWDSRPTRQNWQQSSERLRKTMEILSDVNSEKKFKSAAMSLCNSMASHWGCERVSLGFLKERYVKLKAMSHTEHFTRKMRAVQDIEAAMEECLDQDTEIVFPAPADSVCINQAAEKLSKNNKAVTVLSVPLRVDGETVAVVTLERTIDRLFSFDEIETVRLALELSTPRIVDLHKYDRWLGATIAMKTRRLLEIFVGPKHSWAKLITLLCVGFVLFLIFAKGQYRAEAPFVLEATYRQVVAAPFDGYIKDVEAEVSDMVEGGKTVLARLDTTDLRLELAKAKAERNGYLKQVSAAMGEGQTAQAQVAQANADGVEAQIELLEHKIDQANLIPTLSGVVVQGDLKQQIGAPVQKGDVLFEVCPIDSLHAQLMVPEDRIYDIKVGQSGTLAPEEPKKRYSIFSTP